MANEDDVGHRPTMTTAQALEGLPRDMPAEAAKSWLRDSRLGLDEILAEPNFLAEADLTGKKA
jgi:hypothetical protein